MISAVLSKSIDASYGTIDNVTLRGEDSSDEPGGGGGVGNVVLHMI